MMRVRYKKVINGHAFLWTGLCLLSLWGASLAQAPFLAQPAGIKFDVSLSYSAEGNIFLSYTLSNTGTNPLVVHPSELTVVYGATKIPYRLIRSPAPGRANRLSQRETESGIIVIYNPPYDSDNLQLVWSLFEIGPNTWHTLLRSFGDIMVDKLIGSAPTQQWRGVWKRHKVSKHFVKPWEEL